MVNKSKKDMAYTMLDATGKIDDTLKRKLADIPAVIRVRIL
jgi:D-3-phosphoglycerate dehydrogenase